MEGVKTKIPIRTGTECSISDSQPLIKNRKYLRQRVTKCHNRISNDPESQNVSSWSTALESIREIKNDLAQLDRDIFVLLVKEGASDEELEKQHDDGFHYKALCIDVIRQIENILTSLNNNSDSPDFSLNNSASGGASNNYVSNVPILHKLKLPDVPLPTFSKAKDESLEKFFHNFESVVNKHNLTSYEKFVYLKNQLSGAPLTLINSLDVQELNYETAKTLLSKAFASEINVKYEALKNLSKLKLLYNGDPYVFAGEMRSIIASFHNLKIDMDTVLQFFIWQGLNDRLQQQLIQITNTNKPSLQEIHDNIFPAIERYNNLTDKINERHKNFAKGQYHKNNSMQGLNMAVKVDTGAGSNPKFIHCSMCKNDEASDIYHKLKDCTVYNTAKKKVNKLRAMNHCTKCSYANHSTDQCRYKFMLNCRMCQKNNHMYFLCLKPISNNNNNNNNNNSDTGETSNNFSYVEAMQSNTSTTEAVVLPTFTCDAIGIKSKTIRVFKDGGCQKNFICQKLVEELKLPVLKFSVPLTIHGFNSSKKLMTNIVQVKLQINSKIHKVEAISIPSINTRIAVPGIEVITNKFHINGYTLADKFLTIDSDECIIDNVSFILGADGDHVLPMNYKLFGDNIPLSSFIQTPIGVVISGNVQRMINNLGALPMSKSISPTRSLNFVDNQMSPVHTKSVALEVNSSRREYDNSLITELMSSDEEDELEEAISSLQAYEEADYKFSIYDKQGNIDDSALLRAADSVLDSEINRIMNFDDYSNDPCSSETNALVSKYILNTMEIKADGRIYCKLPWNDKNKHMLSKNYNLSSQILKSNLRKLKSDKFKLTMYNDVFKEQEKLGIIEKITDVSTFMNLNPECSFLPHMGVFRMNRETTKLRVVFLSNLSESSYSGPSISHNKAMLPGPNLNHKIFIALTSLRFDKYLLLFDIQKAFLNIGLHESDSNRLMFLWYNNVEREDFSIVAYRSLRLSFGLRCSPCILMICLYYVLVVDSQMDPPRLREVKQSIYNTIYMDNAGYSCNDIEDLNYCYKVLPDIFSKFQFHLQQFTTNSEKLQSEIDLTAQEETPVEVKVLGMIWNRENDTLKVAPVTLNEKACTKREVLKSLGAVYDVFNLYLPLINRAKLFMRSLQIDPKLKWDDIISNCNLNEWRRICRQVNCIPPIEIPRFIGKREGTFSLHVFTDASKAIYGTVIYIRDTVSGNIEFLTARNKLVNNKLLNKTIPSLEMLAITFGVETVFDIYDNLNGSNVVNPVKIVSIELFTDSLVCLHWLRGYISDYIKMQKRSVFVLNKLRIIDTLCQKFPIKFGFCRGSFNPADNVTRACSYKTLSRSNYFGGPTMLKDQTVSLEEDFTVIVPDPYSKPGSEIPREDYEITEMIATVQEVKPHLITSNKFSLFSKTVKVFKYVLEFINKLKLCLIAKGKISNVPIYPCNNNFYITATNEILRREQEIKFADEFRYLNDPKNSVHDIPELVSKLNIFIDSDGLLRVKSKFAYSKERNFPILLPKHSDITNSIILDTHVKFKHMGLYLIIKELRSNYWILHYFSTVKRVLDKCNLCKRLNNRKIRLNQNSYRDMRIAPPAVPFSYCYLDYFGPYTVKLCNERKKVYILVLTCMWSRAVSLKICISLDVNDFLMSLQRHIFQFGIFTLCTSDLGSQIVAGSKIITNFLNDVKVYDYLQENGINSVKFDQYSKGNSSLGSLVENCVKQCKNLIYKSIKNNVLDYFEFEFVIDQTMCLINKRPISFQQSLRDNNPDIPQPISPEMLLNGRELISINVVPNLQSQADCTSDQDWKPPNCSPENIRTEFTKIKKVREDLIKNYHGEFLQNLINQATDKKHRYTPTKHDKLRVGDVVLLVEQHGKPSTYPLGIVEAVETNSNNEVTAARVRKGRTKETVYRHSTSLILLIPNYMDTEEEVFSTRKADKLGNLEIERRSPRPSSTRSSALKAKAFVKGLVDENLL